MAAGMVALLVVTAMVLDFGVARLDRQKNKGVADMAATAGMRGLDQGDGRIYSWQGVCQALAFLKANEPQLAGLNEPKCSSATELAKKCEWGVASTYASFSGTANGISVQIANPYDLTSASSQAWTEEAASTLAGDRLTAPESCNHLAVVVRQTRKPGLGSIATSGDLTTAIRSVGRVAEKSIDDLPVALLLLEQRACGAVVVNGVNSGVKVYANGTIPGMIHSDSSGELCSGQQRVLVGDHTDGIKAFRSTVGAGLVRVRALGTPMAVHAFDSATNVVAEGGTPAPGPLVTRRPIDLRYMTGARNAISDYEVEEAKNGAGYTQKACSTGAAELAAVTGPLWISCGANSFSASNLTLQASRVFFDAKSVTGAGISIPNATHVYIKGDTAINGTGLNVSSGSFKMGQGSGTTACPSTLTTSTTLRARLVIGAGSVTSNSTGNVQMCGTTVILRGGVTGGCIPGTAGLAPSDTATCNGRLSLNGPTDWTAPSTTAAKATEADWDQLEDLAVWSEGRGSHTVGGGGAMTLSGIFFLPNGEFKVHGGSSQNVLNSQYIARTFVAAGGSVLEMKPNPYDVVGIPALTGFVLVR